MAEFLLIYRNNRTSADAASITPEMAQQSTQRWISWIRQLDADGHLKDGGHPLERSGKIVQGGSKSITEWPIADAKDFVGGYSIITASDIAQAAELAKGCPIFDSDGSVEVRPVQAMTR